MHEKEAAPGDAASFFASRTGKHAGLPLLFFKFLRQRIQFRAGLMDNRKTSGGAGANFSTIYQKSAKNS